MTSILIALLLSGGFSPGASGGSASPLTTKGDLYTYSTTNDRLPTAINGLCLQTDSTTATGLKWGSCGGGTPFNVVEVQVDFGVGNTTAATVVTGQTWVTSTSKIACGVTMLATANRAEGAEDAIIEQLVGAPHTRSVGVGFTLTAHPAFGKATGKYLFHCVGG